MNPKITVVKLPIYKVMNIFKKRLIIGKIISGVL